MYVKSIHIENIRSIASLRWEISESKYRGWHVFIGDNGSGKSSVLRATALAFIGPIEAMALRQNWSHWLRQDEKSGRVIVYVDPDPKFDRFAGKGGRVKNFFLPCGVRITRSQSQGVRISRSRFKKFDPDRHIWSGKLAWFSAGYGPFRRFAGGDKDAEKLFYANPRLARHLSIFGEAIALSECLSWLQSLQFRRLEAQQRGEPEAHPDILLVEQIKAFVNRSAFLPHEAQLTSITSEAVTFVDGNDRHVPVEELSDGYRSILSMTFELIRQLVDTYGVEHVFDPENSTRIVVPGVVLIDEIDAHLHPSWQRQIGAWLCEHFPNIQFMVTTHSPLICHGGQNTTVYRLPKPGSDREGGMLTGAVLDRLLYGNVLDAYGTGEFGDGVTRSEAGHKRLQRLAALNRKQLKGRLTAAETAEQTRLQRSLPTTAYTVDEDM